MNNKNIPFTGFEKVNVINLYLTPFAIILVLMAIIFSQPTGWALYGSLILLIVSLFNNLFSPSIIRNIPEAKMLRMISNVVVNVMIVYFLIGYWGPIWYLFLLTPIATAVYSTRKKTFTVADTHERVVACYICFKRSYVCSRMGAGSVQGNSYYVLEHVC